MKKILKISVADFKLIFRDPSLRGFLVLPLIFIGLIVWFLPGLIDRYPELLKPYTSLFLALAVIENTQMFCAISSMILLDEKESGVAKAYGIVPLQGRSFLLSRFLFPYLITVLLNIILLYLQPFFMISLPEILLISLLVGLVVPVYVLAINIFAKNRLEGLVYIKAFNILVILPLAAFFVPDHFRHLFGLLPTHWLYQTVYNVCEQQSMLFPAMIGFAFTGVLMIWTAKKFLRKHFV